MRNILALALFSFLFPSLPAYGAETIFAFDLGPSMTQVCPDGVNSPLTLAKARARQRLATATDGSAVVLGFSHKIEVLVEGTGSVPAQALSRLRTSDTEGSLAAAFAAAGELALRRRAGDSRIVIYSAGATDSARPLVNTLGTLAAAGVPVELNLFDPAAPATHVGSDDGGSLRVVLYGCGLAVDPERAAILRRVRESVSRHTGLAPEEIAADVPLTAVTADRLQVYEIVAELAREFGLSPPEEDAISISALVDIIAHAPAARKEGDAVAAEMHIDAAPAFTARAVAKEALFQQKIFYATNRQRTGRTEAGHFYGGGRAPMGKTEYGTCVVTIPASHKEGTVETPFLGLTFLEDEKEHVRLLRVSPMGREDFFRVLQGSLSTPAIKEGWENDAVVFVHGFNVPFDEAAKRTAQMAFDFGFKGAPILFSWPSDGKFYAYLADREDIQWSVQHIEQFLNELSESLLPRRIHLVAHSMGNQGLIGALNMLALRRGVENRPLFENVILAAPDFDAQLFQEQIAPRVQKIARRWTVYTSDNDAALNISTTINSARRLGLPVTPVNGIDVVDATGIEVTPWSVPEFHSYYATKQTVIRDIVDTIKGVAPSMRALLPRVEHGMPYWRLGAATKGK